MSLDKGQSGRRNVSKVSAYDQAKAIYSPKPKIDTLISRQQAFLKKMSIETNNQLESHTRKRKLENLNDKYFQSVQAQHKNKGLQFQIRRKKDEAVQENKKKQKREHEMNQKMYYLKVNSEVE